MEQTTLQQRIEERAKQRLLKHLYDAASYEFNVSQMLGKENYPQRLNVQERYDNFNHKTDIHLYNDFSKEIFEKLLPNFIGMLTDEILKKIDEMDYLLQKEEYAESE